MYIAMLFIHIFKINYYYSLFIGSWQLCLCIAIFKLCLFVLVVQEEIYIFERSLMDLQVMADGSFRLQEQSMHAEESHGRRLAGVFKKSAGL